MRPHAASYISFGEGRSIAARAAEDNGLLPLTRAIPALARLAGITRVAARRRLLDAGASEWHHTGLRAMATNYYDVRAALTDDESAYLDAREVAEAMDALHEAALREEARRVERARERAEWSDIDEAHDAAAAIDIDRCHEDGLSENRDRVEKAKHQAVYVRDAVIRFHPARLAWIAAGARNDCGQRNACAAAIWATLGPAERAKYKEGLKTLQGVLKSMGRTKCEGGNCARSQLRSGIPTYPSG